MVGLVRAATAGAGTAVVVVVLLVRNPVVKWTLVDARWRRGVVKGVVSASRPVVVLIASPVRGGVVVGGVIRALWTLVVAVSLWRGAVVEGVVSAGRTLVVVVSLWVVGAKLVVPCWREELGQPE